MESPTKCPDAFLSNLDYSQPFTTNAKLGSASAPEVDTEKLYPSRSTTGSESLNHDDNRPLSVASGPTEPFHNLHEPKNSIGISSQLHKPAPSMYHSSDASAKEMYYNADAEWDRIIPKEVLCYLKVIFKGKKLSKRKRFQLDWQDDASYGIVNNAAQKCLNASPETINKKVWRNDGVCKLFKKDLFVSSKALESEDQWSEVLHLIIAEFVTTPGNEYAKFHLEITWAYAAVENPGVKKPYSKEIADRIDATMRTNWRNKNFIPQRDLHALMTQSVIEYLIDKDESLKSMQDSNSADGPIFDQKNSSMMSLGNIRNFLPSAFTKTFRSHACGRCFTSEKSLLNFP